MKLTTHSDQNVQMFREALNVGKSFDILERIFTVYDKTFYLYFLDGFAKDTNLEYVRRDINNCDKDTFKTIRSANELAQKAMSSIEVSSDNDMDNLVSAILMGQTVLQ